MGTATVARHRLRGTLELALLALGVAACQPPDRAPRAPSFGRLGSVSDTTRAVVGYAESLAFDTSHGARDEQQLHVGSCPVPCAHGPVARIEPEKGAVALSRAQLAEGRVVARIVNQDTSGYAKFGVRPRSVTYWWVDSTAVGWRSVFVSTAKDAPPVVADLTIEAEHEVNYGQAVARWLWDPGDEGAWASCARSTCCQSGGQ